MTNVNITKVYPEPYQAVVELNSRVSECAVNSGLDDKLIELVKLRASQLNGCAFCLRMHTADAIAYGETSERLAVLAAWWESQYFSDAERAALQLTEQVTLISDHGRLADRGVDVGIHLSEKQIAAVTWLAIVLNSWNRIAICSHYPVAPQ